MADLSVNTQEGAPRVLDFVYGAALGVSALFLSAGLLEVVKVAEFGQADMYGPGAYIKISDTVTATIGTPNIETLHVQEFGQVDLYGPGKWLKIQDTVTASIGSSIDVNKSESLKLSETATPTLTPLQTSGFDEVIFLEDGVLYEELLHVQDTVTASITQGPQNQELLHIQDTVSAGLDSEQVSATESLKIADTVNVRMTLIQALATESLHVQDFVNVSRPAPRTLPLLYSSVTNRPILWSSE